MNLYPYLSTYRTMGDTRGPTRPKRHSKSSRDNTFDTWDCSVCTFRNSAHDFKCLMCDVRKGTSSRKSRLVSAVVAQQENQQYMHHKRKEPSERARCKNVKKRNNLKTTRPLLTNIDRSSAEHFEVTVGDLTVKITDFKEKIGATSTSASVASTDQLSHSGFSSDNTEWDTSRCSSHAETVLQ